MKAKGKLQDVEEKKRVTRTTLMTNNQQQERENSYNKQALPLEITSTADDFINVVVVVAAEDSGAVAENDIKRIDHGLEPSVLTEHTL